METSGEPADIGLLLWLDQTIEHWFNLESSPQLFLSHLASFPGRDIIPSPSCRRWKHVGYNGTAPSPPSTR